MTKDMWIAARAYRIQSQMNFLLLILMNFGGENMVYKCKKCQLLGAGWSKTGDCPNCGETLFIKRSRGEMGGDMYEGDFISYYAAVGDIFSILHTFSYTDIQLYVSPDIDKFLKNKGFNHFNYKVDPSLSYLEMNIR